MQNSDGETEIVLGNKRLLGIFFVVVILLGVAFTAGYKVGQGSKKSGLASPDTTAASSNGGETHGFPPEGSSNPPPASSSNTGVPSQPESAPPPTPEPGQQEGAPLGSPTPAKVPAAPKVSHPKPSEEPESPAAATGFAPQSGQIFLQVAAVSRDEALAVAEVLRKKGFPAHAVPRPGGGKLYRVIIGPTRDASDLNNTRGALRNAGFREIFVQHY